jgi:PAS domain S-box-containing protein
MTIHLRFFLLTASIMGVLFTGIWMQDHWDKKETQLLRQGMTKEREVLVDNLLDITGEPLRVFVTDYSPWDEMVNFVTKPDEEWARINIVESLDTHKIDAAWIFRPDLTEVFGTVARDREELRPFPLPHSTLAGLIPGKSEIHFFTMTSAGMTEILGAPIRPSDRSLSIPAPLGWLFAARLWNSTYLQKLSLLADSQVGLISAKEPSDDKADDLVVTSSKPLPDWKGRPLQILKVRHSPIALKHMKQDSQADLLISTGFGTIALIAFFFATRLWLIRPLGLLEASLVQGNAAPLQQLRTGTKEFVRLGQLVEKSFQHKQALRQIFAAFNAIEDAVFILETESRRITHANDGAVKLLGYRHEELNGRLLADLETDPIGSAHPLRVQPQLILNTRWYRCRDGRLVEVEIREQTLPTTSVAPIRVIVARDVTELKRQEQQRLQAQRLESLGNLAGGVAHDMNNMLTPITMFLEDLQQTNTRPSPELLASVRSSVKRGADILRQLLTFGRGIAGERQPLDVKRLLDEIGRIVTSTFPKSILFEARAARQVSTVLGDATQIHQVLLNLCVNARDAMPNGGRLELTAANLVLDTANASEWRSLTPGRYVQIEVADTGSGIPPEVIDRIFEPFFTTKSVDQGTGLGLSTSLGIIQSHNGAIQVESKLGQGTRLRLLLPAADKTAKSDIEDRPESFEGKGRTVLVVEDEANIRALLEKTLKRLSLTVLLADEGDAGLALFRSRRTSIDLIISDLHMPGMDGMKLIQAIRQEAPNIPILVMSGRIDDRTREGIAALKATTIVDKPFGYSQIVHALGNVFS